MAILKKRTSTKKLPEAKDFDVAPLKSVISNLNDRPSLTGRRSSSVPDDFEGFGDSSSGSAISGRAPSISSNGTAGSGRTPALTSSIATNQPAAGSITRPTPAAITKPSTTVNTRPSTTINTKPAVTTTKPANTTSTTKPAVTTKPVTSITTKPAVTTTPAKTTSVTKPVVTTKPVTTKPVTTKPVVTTTGTTKPVITTKPVVTTKPVTTTKPVITTKTTPTSVVKPVVTKPTTNTTTSKVVNALTGAAVGAGTKLLIDKITGKPTVAKPPAGVKPSAGGASAAVTAAKDAAAKALAAKTAGAKPPAKTTPPITSTVLTEEEIQTKLDEAKALEGTGAPPEEAVDNGDGTYSVFEDGMVTTYDANGAVVGMGADTAANPAEVESIYDDANQAAASGGSDSEADEVITGDSDANDAIAVVNEGSEGSEGTQYFQDPYGNYYTMNDDGGYDLAFNADGSVPEDTEETEETEEPEITSYTDPDTGAEWTLGGDGEWTTEFDYGDYTNYPETDSVEDAGYTFTDNTDYTDYTDNSNYTITDNENYDEELDYGKKGGLMSMKRGGAPVHMVRGGELFGDDETVSEEENEDGTITQYFDDGSSITIGKDGEVVSVTDAEGVEDDDPYAEFGGIEQYSKYGENGIPITGSAFPEEVSPYDLEPLDNSSGAMGAGTNKITDEQAQQIYNDPRYNPAYSAQNQQFLLNSENFTPVKTRGLSTPIATQTATSISNPAEVESIYDNFGGKDVYSNPAKGFGSAFPSEIDQSYIANNVKSNQNIADVSVIDSVDNGDGTYTQYYSDGSEETFDNATSNVSYNPDGTTSLVPITSAGSGERPWYENIGSKLSKSVQDLTGMSDETLKTLTGALPAAGAGALVASLLGNDFGGGEQNQGLDMSKVGLINPRTTDFGIGPTNFVGYEDYGTSGDDYTPNAELLKNLNAPGYNPVNEGDYGYEEVAEEETPMASGGLSSMSTPVSSYYTFGQPADILANLGMRPQPPMNPPEMMAQVGQQKPPQQMQKQVLPQQMPPQMAQQAPQGMPQQGMPPPMRRGGLSHVSNVPMTQGRMDFRRGSAVHGEGDGQSDDIPAMLADGEYVLDAELVAQIGNGSTKAGAQALDRFRENIRAHKRSAPVNKIPPKTKVLTSYLKGAR